MIRCFTHQHVKRQLTTYNKQLVHNFHSSVIPLESRDESLPKQQETKLDQVAKKFEAILDKHKKQKALTLQVKQAKPVVKQHGEEEPFEYKKRPSNKRQKMMQEKIVQTECASRLVDEKLSRLFPSKSSAIPPNRHKQQKSIEQSQQAQQHDRHMQQIQSNNQLERLVSQIFKIEDFTLKTPEVVAQEVPVQEPVIPIPDLALEEHIFDSVEHELEHNQLSWSDGSAMEQIRQVVQNQPDGAAIPSISHESSQPSFISQLALTLSRPSEISGLALQARERTFMNAFFQKKRVAMGNVPQNTVELANPVLEVDPEIRAGVLPNYSIYEGFSEMQDYDEEDQVDGRDTNTPVDEFGYRLVPAGIEDQTSGIVLDVDRVVGRKPATAESTVDMLVGNLTSEEQLEFMRIHRSMLPGLYEELITFNIQGENSFKNASVAMEPEEIRGLFSSEVEDEVAINKLESKEEDEFGSDDEEFNILDDGYTPIPSNTSTALDRAIAQIFESEEVQFEQILTQYESNNMEDRQQYMKMGM